MPSRNSYGIRWRLKMPSPKLATASEGGERAEKGSSIAIMVPELVEGYKKKLYPRRPLRKRRGGGRRSSLYALRQAQGPGW